MAKEMTKESLLSGIFHLVPSVLAFPEQKMWIDYDKEADVLYLSFRRPQKATDSKMLDDGVLLRYRRRELIGVTILDASLRRKSFPTGQFAAKEPTLSYGKQRKRKR